MKAGITIFESKTIPGAIMNRYGAVFIPEGGVKKRLATPEERGAITREAMALGWHLVPDSNKDIGYVWREL